MCRAGKEVLQAGGGHHGLLGSLRTLPSEPESPLLGMGASVCLVVTSQSS